MSVRRHVTPGGFLHSPASLLWGYTGPRSLVICDREFRLSVTSFALGVRSLTEAKLGARLVQPLPVPHARHLRFGGSQLCHCLCPGKA